MEWDDELEEFTTPVGDLLDDDFLNAAASRAITAAPGIDDL